MADYVTDTQALVKFMMGKKSDKRQSSPSFSGRRQGRMYDYHSCSGADGSAVSF